MILEIAKQLSLFTVGAGLLTFLVQSLAKHLLSKDIETFKANLQMASVEHEIAYRRLDARFDEYLVRVCQLLYSFYDRVRDYLADIGPEEAPFPEEKLKAITTASNQFWDYFLNNRIYIPPALYCKMRELAVTLRRIMSANGRNEKAERMGAERSEAKFEEPHRMLEQEATPLFKEVEAAVQKRLGGQRLVGLRHEILQNEKRCSRIQP